jgi:hypothetical protein
MPTRTDVFRACRGHELENAKMSSSNPKIKMMYISFFVSFCLSRYHPDTLVYKGFLSLTKGKIKHEYIYFWTVLNKISAKP